MALQTGSTLAGSIGEKQMALGRFLGGDSNETHFCSEISLTALKTITWCSGSQKALGRE